MPLPVFRCRQVGVRSDTGTLPPRDRYATAAYVAWTTPLEDAWKLNFAVRAPNDLRQGGAGYVLREHHGIFKATRAEPLSTDFRLVEAKLVALELGIQEAIVQGIDYLEVEGHSANAIELAFNKDALVTPSIEFIVNKCHKLLQAFRLMKFQPVAECANKAAIKVADMERRKGKTKPHSSAFCVSSAAYVAWTTPLEDAWKLNFAVRAPNDLRQGGAGYVLREHHGIFKATRAEPLSTNFSLVEAKLVALELGIQEAIVQGIDYLEVEGHSANAIELAFNKDALVTPSIEFIVNKCHKLLQAFRLMKFQLVADCANRAAIKVADMATNEAETQYWTTEPPTEVATLLVEDTIGYWEVAYY
ncbi:uncharacterized protein Fot_50367 [Forsythia ovata]|uniref:RNase H type-1 domain-containing protein n=1 Tax=Forsythia ovata TaxID=205694 RepID=A0ABD1Q1Y7_9LAMI